MDAMGLSNIEDIAHVQFRAPDLVGMRAFLEDFGLTIAEATDDRLVARGTGSAPVLHVRSGTIPASPPWLFGRRAWRN